MKIDELFNVRTAAADGVPEIRKSLEELIDEFFEENYPGSKNHPTDASTEAARQLTTKLLVAKTHLWHFRFVDDRDNSEQNDQGNAAADHQERRRITEYLSSSLTVESPKT